MPEDVTKLYNFMDANGDGFISLNEMKLLLEGSQESVKDRMKSFSPEFDLQMKTNIKKNFDKYNEMLDIKFRQVEDTKTAVRDILTY